MAVGSRSSVGPWQISELDAYLINEVFRQIEEQINLLRGLGADAISIGEHTHQTAAAGGQISHDLSLTGVSPDDHHNKSHLHNGADGSGSVDHGALTTLIDDDHTQYLLASQAGSRSTFDTNWTDLTDAGSTLLHSHAAAGAGETDNQTYDANATATRITDELIAGTGVTLTELAEGSGDALQISIDTSGFVTTSDVSWIDLTDSGATTLHTHSGQTAETDQSLYDAASTVPHPWEHFLAGTNVTFSESSESGAVTISSTGGIPLWNINLAQLAKDYVGGALQNGDFTVGNAFRPLRPNVKTTGLKFYWGGGAGALSANVHLRSNGSLTTPSGNYSTTLATVSSIAVDAAGVYTATFSAEQTLTENQWYAVDLYESTGTKYLASPSFTQWRFNSQVLISNWIVDPAGIQYYESLFAAGNNTPSPDDGSASFFTISPIISG